MDNNGHGRMQATWRTGFALVVTFVPPAGKVGPAYWRQSSIPRRGISTHTRQDILPFCMRRSELSVHFGLNDLADKASHESRWNMYAIQASNNTDRLIKLQIYP